MPGASLMTLDGHGQMAAHLVREHHSLTCLWALLDSVARPGGPGGPQSQRAHCPAHGHEHVVPRSHAVLAGVPHRHHAVDFKGDHLPFIHAVENNSLSMVQLLQHGANENA